VIVGVWTPRIFARAMSYALVSSSWAILPGFAVSTLVGVLLGSYPARQASRLDPLAALGSQPAATPGGAVGERQPAQRWPVWREQKWDGAAAPSPK
jgi:hypothetical protein